MKRQIKYFAFFIALFFVTMIHSKTAYAVTNDPHTFYNTYINGGRAVVWQDNAFYFCTKATASTSGTRFRTVGFQIKDPDGHVINCQTNGAVLKWIGTHNQTVGSDVYNLYKVDYFGMITYFSAAYGNSAETQDHFIGLTRNGNNPLFTFNALMIKVVDGVVNDKIFENGNGQCSIVGTVYSTLGTPYPGSGIKGAAPWGNPSDLDNYYNIQAKAIGTAVDGTPPSGFFYPAGHSWTNASAENISFHPIDADSGVCSSDVDYIISRDGGATWEYNNWYNYGGASDYTATVSIGNEQFIFQPYAYVTDNVGNSSGVIWGDYYYYDRISPTGFYSPSSKDWGNESTYNFTFTPSDVGSGVNHSEVYYMYSRDNGQTWSDLNYYFRSDGAQPFSVLINAEPAISYRFMVKVFDNAGNVSENWSGDYKFDRVAPSGTYSPSSKDWGNESTYNFTFSPSDVGSGVEHSEVYYIYSSDKGQTWSGLNYYFRSNGNQPFSVPINAEPAISYRFMVKVFDYAGNETDNWSGEYKFDRVPPSGYYTPNSKGWGNESSYNVTVNTNDILSGVNHSDVYYMYSLDNGKSWTNYTYYFTSYSTSFNISMTTENNQNIIYKFYTKVFDNAGNEGDFASEYYKFDRVLPNATITPFSAGDTNQPIYVTFDPSDNYSGVSKWYYRVRTSLDWGASYTDSPTYSVDGDTTQTYRIEPIAGQVAKYIINYSVIDNAGNVMGTQSGEYWIDAKKPTVSVTPNNRPWANTNVTVNLKGYDNVGGKDTLKNIYYKWEKQNTIAPFRISDNVSSTPTVGISTSQGTATGYTLGNLSPSSPPSGWTRYDDTANSNMFIYENMKYLHVGDTTEFQNGDLHLQDNVSADSSFTFIMNGTQFVLGNETYQRNQNVSLYIDGKYNQTFSNLYRTTANAEPIKTQFISPILPAGRHVITIRTDQSKGFYQFVLDRIDVKGTLVAPSTINTYNVISSASDVNNPLTQTEEGQWYLWYYAEDKYGNVSDPAVSGAYQIFKTAPYVNVNPTNRPWNNTDVSVTLTATSVGMPIRNLYYKWDTQPFSPPTSGYTTVNRSTTTIMQPSEGKWYLWYWVDDTIGNTSPKYVSGQYQIDKTLPYGTFNPNDDSSFIQGSDNTIIFTPSDALSGVLKWRYRLSQDGGTTWGTFGSYVLASDVNQSDITLNTNGNWKIEVEVTDKAGNVGVVKSNAYSIIKLLLQNFRITNIVNPPSTYTYPIDISHMPVDVKSGYNVTYQIDVVGVADAVAIQFSDIYGMNNKNVDMIKVRDIDSAHSVWECTTYTNLDTPLGTIIYCNIFANKGAYMYYYNNANHWTGETLNIIGCALDDVGIQRIY